MGPVDQRKHHPPWNRGRVILCVDDEPGVLNAVRRSLRDEPYDVITAGSSEEALGWLDELPVDLVITDQRMPGMLGTELLKEVRKRSPKTAIALLTGFRNASTVVQGLEAGAETFLYKPWDERHLVDTVRRLLGVRDGVLRPRQIRD
jgi:DNA-binding NtrC family response regulator